MGRRGHLRMGLPVGGGVVSLDTFSRADSAPLGAAEKGPAWVAHSGSLGVKDGRAWSPTDANASTSTVDAGTGRCVVDCIVNGIILSGTDYSVPGVVLHYIDGNNFLRVSVTGRLFMHKVDGGAYTAVVNVLVPTADLTDYWLRVVLRDELVKLYLDGVERATYSMTPEEWAKYRVSTRYGLRHLKAGAPASNAARWDNWRVSRL